MIKINFMQRLTFGYGMLLFILGLISAQIDDIIYSGISIIIGCIIIEIIFYKFVMKDTGIIEGKDNLYSLTTFVEEHGKILDSVDE